MQFRHCGGLWDESKHPKNAGSYFGYIGMGQYLNGIVAGHSHQVEEARFRRRQADPAGAAQHQFLPLGARSVDPSITTQVIFTGDWSMPVKEAEADQRARRQGVDVVTCHVDGPKVVVADRGRPRHLRLRLPRQPGDARAERLSHRRRVELGRQSTRCSSKSVMARQAAAEFRARRSRRRFRQDEPLRPGGVRTPRASRSTRVKAEMMKGGYRRHQGPAEGQQGQDGRRRPAQAYPETAIELEKMNYLVEGVDRLDRVSRTASPMPVARRSPSGAIGARRAGGDRS